MSSTEHIFRKCPRCLQELYRSVVLTNDGEVIILLCTTCQNHFEVKNTSQQRSEMSTGEKHWFRQEDLTDISQLGIGDVFGYKSNFVGLSYHHSSLCYDINREDKFVRIIELMNYNFEARIVMREIPFEHILNGKDCIVFRYKSLDCLPLNQTLQRALSFADAQNELERAEAEKDKEVIERAKAKVWPQSYDGYDNNCQHFTSDCKTGVKKSVDGEHYQSRDPGCFAKNYVQTKKYVLGWSSQMSEKISNTNRTSSGASASSCSPGGWSSSQLASSVWTKTYIKGLVKQWSSKNEKWASQMIPLT